VSESRVSESGVSESRASESGVSLTPLVVGFIMILVCFGVVVDAHGTVEGAARDAARMGSLERDDAAANKASDQAAAADLGNTCTSFTVMQVEATSKTEYHAFDHGELYTIEVSCTIDLSGLNWFGLPPQTIVSYSAAPLDVFRRTG